MRHWSVRTRECVSSRVRLVCVDSFCGGDVACGRTLRPGIFITVHSGERENHRTEDKLITLMKKVCSQLSHFSQTQEPGDPCTNLVRADRDQVAKWKTKPSGFSLKDEKSRFSLIVEQRFRNTSSRPIMTEEVSKN